MGDAVDNDWMSKGVRFFAKGAPRSQPRPRFVKGRVVSIVNKSTKAWKRTVEAACGDAMKTAAGVGRTKLIKPLSGPVRVDMVFYMGTKDSKKDKKFFINRPDKDNLEKLVLDAMESVGMFEKGDQQVVAGDVQKYWSIKKTGVLVMMSRPVNVLTQDNDAFNQIGF